MGKIREWGKHCREGKKSGKDAKSCEIPVSLEAQLPGSWALMLLPVCLGLWAGGVGRGDGSLPGTCHSQDEEEALGAYVVLCRRLQVGALRNKPTHLGHGHQTYQEI